MPRLCEFNPGICLTTEEKAGKNLSQGSRRVTVYILHITKTPTHYKTTHTHTHTLQNNIKPPHQILRPKHLYDDYYNITTCFGPLFGPPSNYCIKTLKRKVKHKQTPCTPFVKGAKHSQLNWAILLCDVMPDGITE